MKKLFVLFLAISSGSISHAGYDPYVAMGRAQAQGMGMVGQGMVHGQVILMHGSNTTATMPQFLERNPGINGLSMPRDLGLSGSPSGSGQVASGDCNAAMKTSRMTEIIQANNVTSNEEACRIYFGTSSGPSVSASGSNVTSNIDIYTCASVPRNTCNSVPGCNLTSSQVCQGVIDQVAIQNNHNALIAAKAQESQAQKAVFLESPRNIDGSLVRMHQEDAVRYCACDSDDSRRILGCKTPPNSAHLPNARELAHLAKSLRVGTIVNNCGSNSKCYLVQAKNADGSSDNFSFRYAKQQPASDSSNNRFWSSSEYSGNPFLVYAFDLNDGLGKVDYYSGAYDFAVRCVVGR